MRRAASSILGCFASCLLCALPTRARAQAEERGASEATEWVEGDEEAAQLAWQNFDPRAEGSAVMTLSGELAIVDRQGMTGHQRELGGGLNFAILGGRKSWPMLLGFGVGITTLDFTSRQGPEVGFFGRDTSYDRSLDLPHGELMVRVQPWSGRVRPYIEGLFGVAGLRDTTVWQDSNGDVLDQTDHQRSISYLTGGSAGLDIVLLALGEDVVSISELVLSVGVRRLYTGPMKWSTAVLSEDEGEARLTTERERLRIWQPFVSLTLSLRSKPRPANAAYVGAQP